MTASNTSPVDRAPHSQPKPTRRPRLRQRAKKLAWRLTAIYAWLCLLTILIFGSATVTTIQGSLADRFFRLLSSIGFAPVNGAALPSVLKAGWLLTITGFNPIQIIGLAIYVASAPVWLFFRRFYGDALSQTEPPRLGLAESRSNWSALPLFTAAVVGWFILYGAASSFKELAVGVIFSGLLLIIFTYRALQRTKPLTILEVSVLDRLEKFGASLPNSVQTRENKTPTSKRSEAVGHIVTYSFFRDAVRHVTIFIRGKRGRDRVYMFILVEYVLFLFILGLTAIFFWALVAKTAAAPHPENLSTAFYYSASHFLPGVTVPSLALSLPPWVQIGPSVTAWILFVLLVGPAASIVPVRQNAYGARLAVTYGVLRHCTLFLSGYIRRLERLKQTLT